jgi:hypothetical protein
MRDPFADEAQRILAEVESSSHRCLICANINPCSQHSGQAQRDELRRNDAAIAAIRAGDR